MRASGFTTRQIAIELAGGGTRPGRRRSLTWLAVAALVFQLFITQVHGFMGGLPWSEQGSSPSAAATAWNGTDGNYICHADPDAVPASDNSRTHREECPIYQSLPIVSAALASAAIVVPAPADHPREAEAPRPAAIPQSTRLDLRPEPRAPPIPA